MFLQLTSNEEECGCVAREKRNPCFITPLSPHPPGERGWRWGWRVDVDSGQFSEHLATSSSSYNSRPLPPPLCVITYSYHMSYLPSCAILYSCSCSSAPNNLLLTDLYKFVTKTYW